MKNPSFLHSIIIVSFFALSDWQGAKPFFVIYPVDLPPSQSIDAKKNFPLNKDRQLLSVYHFGKPNPPS